MTRREELIELAGQAINGMLSADSELHLKIIDDVMHDRIAELAVTIAVNVQHYIDEVLTNKHKT
jgi:hypothetical protein